MRGRKRASSWFDGCHLGWFGKENGEDLLSEGCVVGYSVERREEHEEVISKGYEVLLNF